MKFGKRSCIVLLASFLVVPALAQELKPVNRPDELGFAADRLERVTKVFQGYVDNGQLPGAVVLIARNDQVAYLKAFGYRDRERKMRDDAGLDLPHRLHDQTDCQRRSDDLG